MEFGDASTTIERYRDALKHGRHGRDGVRQAVVPGAWGGRGRTKAGTGWKDEEEQAAGGAVPAPPPLPRHPSHPAPGRSAARRLIIAAAQGIVVTLPPFCPRKPKPRISDTVAAMRRLGLAVALSQKDFARYQAELKAAERRTARPRRQNFSLLDPLKYFFRIRRKYVPAHLAPRITWLDGDTPRIPLPPPPTRDDPIGAANLTLRLEALGRALDDLPGQAQRLARWKARHDAALARDKAARDAAAAKGKPGPVRFRRFSPLRRGRPPGGRLPRFDPDAPKRKNIREVDEILAHANSMALYALEPPRRDTS